MRGFIVLHFLAPSPPRNIRTVLTLKPTTSVLVFWDSPEGGNAISSYAVTVQPSSSRNITAEDSVDHDPEITSYNTSFSDLVPGETYDVTVTTTNVIGVAPSATQFTTRKWLV